MFLVFSYHGLDFSRFVLFLREQAQDFVTTEINKSKLTVWYAKYSINDAENHRRRIQNRVFRFLFDMVSALYIILKDIRILGPTELVNKYPFLPKNGQKTKQDLKTMTSFVEADAIFHVGLCRFAGNKNRNYEPHILIPVLKSRHIMECFQNHEYSKGFQAINDTKTFSSNSKYKISKPVKHHIKWSMTEYFSENNPFPKHHNVVQVNSLPKREDIVPVNSLSKREDIVPVNSLSKREDIVPVNSQSKAKREDIEMNRINHQIPDQREHIFPAVIMTIRKNNISLDCFKDILKQKFLRQPIIDFLSTDYLLISPSFSFELYPSVSRTQVGDMLSLLLHAVRLLYLHGTIDCSSVFHFPSQILLQKIFANKTLDTADAVKNLNMEQFLVDGNSIFLSLTRHFLANQKSRQISELGVIDISTLTTKDSFRTSIGCLFCQLLRHDSNIFFVHLAPFSSIVNCVSSLPRCTEFKYNSSLNIMEDSFGEISDAISLEMLIFGTVYFSKMHNMYKFQYVSYAPNLFSGKYCLVTYCNGILESMVAYEHPTYEKRHENKMNIKAQLEQSSSIPLQMEESYNLVGLLMLRQEKGGVSFPFFERIWKLPLVKFINMGEPVTVYTQSLVELGAQGSASWLTSSTIKSFLVLLVLHFDQIHPNTARRINNIILDSDVFESFKHTNVNPDYAYYRYHKRKRVNIRFASKLLEGIPDDSLVHFPLNHDNMHWSYACVYLPSKSIYLMNSGSGGSSPDWIKNSLLAFCQGFFGGIWSCTSLKSPQQNDDVNCGIYTLMNIAHVVQAVEEADTVDILTSSTRNSKWGNITLPVDTIRSQLANIFVNQKLHIDEMLQHVLL